MFADLSPSIFNVTELGLDDFLILLFNIGNLLAVIAFVVRGPIMLRALAVVGTSMQAFFYAFISTGPIASGVFWKVLMATAALGFMLVLIRERMGRQFPEPLRGLAHELSLLNPGQIAKLFKVGDVRTAPDGRQIIRQDVKPGELYYLLDGSAKVVARDGQVIPVDSATFLGEIAFVSGGVATADVHLDPGATYMAWPVPKLQTLLDREDQIDIALRGLINHDLARKVAANSARTADPQPASTAQAVEAAAVAE